MNGAPLHPKTLNPNASTSWEFRLSSLHLVVVVGLVTGSLAAAFFMGFISGERAGFESGQESAMLAQVPRIPIPHGASGDVTDAPVSEDVYDKLAANLPNSGFSASAGGAYGAGRAGSARAGAESLGGVARASLDDELPTLGKIESSSVQDLDIGSAYVPPAGNSGVGNSAARNLREGGMRQPLPSSLGARDALPGERNFKGDVGSSVTGITPNSNQQAPTLGALDEPRLVPLPESQELHARDSNTRDSAALTGADSVVSREAGARVTNRVTNNGALDSGSRGAFSSPSTVSALNPSGGVPSRVSPNAASGLVNRNLQNDMREDLSRSGAAAGTASVTTTTNAVGKKTSAESVPTSTASIKTQLSKGWYAQVAAPRKLVDAEKMSAKLKRSGFPVIIERANVRGDEYFRVVVGPERDKTQVDRLISQIKRDGYDPFPRAVK